MRLYSMQTLKTATAFRRRCWIFGDLWPPSDALCLATPEYNGGLTPLLLNMFCWASRPSPTDDFGSVFQDKPVALMASSPGRLAVRAIPRLRDCVCELGMLPVPALSASAMRRRPFR